MTKLVMSETTYHQQLALADVVEKTLYDNSYISDVSITDKGDHKELTVTYKYGFEDKEVVSELD